MVQMAKDWSSLSASTRKEIKDLRANGFGNLKDTRETTHFVLHYTTQGSAAVPTLDADHNGYPDFIDAAAKSWEDVYSREVGQLGYAAPKLTTTADGTVTNKFHVYFKDMAYYGYTVPENVSYTPIDGFPSGTASAWIVVENDFVGFPPNDEDVTEPRRCGAGALKVTQAHEFMHALQFNINVYQSGWLMESHATWAEDAVYDGVNDWHWYINRFFVSPSLPIFNRYVYGSAFFQNWLSENYGVDAPRRVWQAATSMSAADAIESWPSADHGARWRRSPGISRRCASATSPPTGVVDPAEPDGCSARRTQLSGRRDDPRCDEADVERRAVRTRANYVEFTPGSTSARSPSPSTAPTGMPGVLRDRVRGEGRPTVSRSLDAASAGSSW
jgi:hypothetical protein